MFRRLVSRRALKWTGTIACILLGAVSIAICRLEVEYSWASGPHQFEVWLGNGAGGWLDIDARRLPSGTAVTLAQGLNVEIDKRSGIEWLPRLTHHGRVLNWYVRLPLWIPFSLIAIPTAMLWRLDGRRPRAGCCRKCDYDLTGNLSGRCPECGAEILRGAAVRANEAVAPQHT